MVEVGALNKKQKIVWVLNYNFTLAEHQSSPSYKMIQNFYSTEDEIPSDIVCVNVLVVGRTIRITAKTIAKLTNCVSIIRPGVGCDNIDVSEAEKHGIKVITIPDYCVDEVADHTFALLLSYSRKITIANEKLLENLIMNWSPSPFESMKRLCGKTLGIIGLGCIGQAVAKRASAFSMNIVYFDPFLKTGMRKVVNASICSSVEQLFGMSDYVSIHTPLTEETKGLVSLSVIDGLSSPVIIINTSRGEVVSNEAIFEGLKVGKIEAFLADVLESEPPNPLDPLFTAYSNKEEWVNGRLILTPHIAYLSQDSTEEVINQTLSLIDSFIGCTTKTQV